MDLLQTLAHLDRVSSTIAHLGSTSRPCLGIVTDNADPEGYLRVKCILSDGQITPWASVCMPWVGIHMDPLPIGATAVLMFADGDPTVPIVLGVLVNSLNPVPGGTGLRLSVPSVSISTESATLGGKEIATLGAKDTRNDTLITKGWGA